MRDPNTLSPDELREKLERMRETMTPLEYAYASARVLKLLEKKQPRRYAIT